MNEITADAMRAPWALVHPAEIAAREFPRSRKGYDTGAVRSWLRAVASAVRTLEGELAYVRAERDRLESVLRRAGEDPPASAVRTALMQSRLRRRPGGYDRAEVDALLEASAAEIARLETRAALLEAEAQRSRDVSEREAALSRTVARLESEIASIRTSLPSTPPVDGLVP